MKNVIDLSPYLPAASLHVQKPRRRRFGSIAAAIESVVTLCIGAGFFLFLVAFFAAI